MPSCFVDARPAKAGSDAGSSDCWSAYRNVLAALRIGFSYEDLRRMTMREFIAYTDLAFTEPKQHKDQPREATQADIDRFLS